MRPSGSLTLGVAVDRRGVGGVRSGFRVPIEADLTLVPVARECRGDSRFRTDLSDDIQERFRHRLGFACEVGWFYVSP